MKHIRIPFLVIALSLALAGMAFAVATPGISTKTLRINDAFAHNTAAGSGLVPGISLGGVGGGFSQGLGDVLLAPLYDVRTITNPALPGAAGTVQQTQFTMFCIVNTDTAYGVVARLRFREWMRSHECLDLDIPLTTRDVWCGEIFNENGTPVLHSLDRYVTNVVEPYCSPIVPGTCSQTDFNADFVPALGIAFKDYLIEGRDITRCQYGYFEIIAEEKVLWNTGKTIFYRRGVPANPNLPTDRDVDAVLMGNVYILRPDQIISHQYNMEAIQNFSVDSRGIYRTPATDRPNLPNDVQGEYPGGVVAPLAQNPGNGGFNELEALLSKKLVNFQYVTGVDPADTTNTPMSTSVVITLPTKWAHYIQQAPHTIVPTTTWPGPTPYLGPYETPGDAIVASYGGEVMNYSLWNRDEQAFGAPPSTPVSPPPPQTPNIPILPYEVNILGLYPVAPAPAAPYFRNNSNIPTQNTSVTPVQTFYSGWGFFDLSPTPGFISGDPRGANDTLAGVHRQGENVSFGGIPRWSYFPNFSFFNNLFTTYLGLPAVGIVMTEFYNDTNNGYYGNTVPWQFEVDWI